MGLGGFEEAQKRVLRHKAATVVLFMHCLSSNRCVVMGAILNQRLCGNRKEHSASVTPERLPCSFALAASNAVVDCVAKRAKPTGTTNA